MKKLIVLLLLMTWYSALLNAQSSATPLLRITPDVRSAALGNTYLNDSKGMYIYQGSTSIFEQPKRFTFDYSYTSLPKMSNDRPQLHTIAGAYRFHSNALMIGFRHLGGIAVKRFDNYGIPGKSIHPYDLTLDIAFAHLFNTHWSAYVGAMYLQSYIGKTAYTGAASAGITYRGLMQISTSPIHYAFSGCIRDIGGKVKYGNTSYHLPSSAELSAMIANSPKNIHHATLYASTRYFFLPSNAQEWSGGIGAEYVYHQHFAARIGYSIENYRQLLTTGLGMQFSHFNFNIAWQHHAHTNIALIGTQIRF